MPTYSIKIDTNAIRKKVLLAAEKAGRPVAFVKANALFKRAKDTMLKDFDEHNVTQEILQGPFAANISNTLGGYGNLFSFIGFPVSSTPIQRLENLLDNETTINHTVTRQGVFYFRVSTPSKKTIEAETPMPWEQGNSWAYGIEQGITGLSYFLQKRTKKSRSTGGIQLHVEVNEDLSFQTTKYLSEILGNFRKRINGEII